MSSLGSRGTAFLVFFMQNVDTIQVPNTIYITTSSAHVASLNISSSPNLSQALKSQVDKSLNFTSNTALSLPFNLACNDFTIEYKAILLKTVVTSSVTLFDADYEYSVDGSLVLPTNKLSNEYLVSTPEGLHLDKYFKCQFAIGVLYNETKINIHFNIINNENITIHGKNFTSGDVLTTTLQELETYEIGHGRDLTGTYITSNKPIAVFSGNRCQKFFPYTGCNHMVSQLPPIDQFDNEYIIPSFYDNSGTFIQIITPVQNDIRIRTGSNTTMWHLTQHKHKNFEIASNETTTVHSTHPVMVTGCAMGSYTNDPYMTVIPGIKQYLDFYKIVVPDQYRENFICVIIPNESLFNLRINNMDITHFKSVFKQSLVFSGKEFSIRTIRVQEGLYDLRTTDQQPFGLIVFGHRPSDGYGFSGNFVLP